MGHIIEIHIGNKIRQRRRLTGMTQQQLAECVGIKSQQIQKYETGANRVSASRLWEIAEALNVPVAQFFTGISVGLTVRQGVPTSLRAQTLPDDPLNDREVMALVRSYYAIAQDQRHRLSDLARVLADVA
jgi:transcriptional regulator with XRE-family HTH domain